MPITAQITIAATITARPLADGGRRQNRGDFRREVKSGERAEHENVAVREIDEAQDAIDHRVAERDEGENRAERQAVDELLEEFGQAS